MASRMPSRLGSLRIAQDPRWRCVVERNPAADGTFVYSVSTTGVYCRPSCGARLPKPEHVLFHRDSATAEAAGFRPCRRCRPCELSRQQTNVRKVAEACRLIEAAEEIPRLNRLARHVGLSPHYFHRLFKAVTGVTPKDYVRALRSCRVRTELKRNRRVTDAVFAAGYASNGRFYEDSHRILGMTPSRFRAHGAGAVIRYAVDRCSLGMVLAATSEVGVCAILLGDDSERLTQELQDLFSGARLVPGDRKFGRTVARIVRAVDVPGTGLDLPLDIRGTAFQQRVWKALRTIPVGRTVSYTDLARRIRAPAASRAVAQACAANILAVAVPCHRVIRNDGALAGYRWGVARKRALLEQENAIGSQGMETIDPATGRDHGAGKASHRRRANRITPSSPAGKMEGGEKRPRAISSSGRRVPGP